MSSLFVIIFTKISQYKFYKKFCERVLLFWDAVSSPVPPAPPAVPCGSSFAAPFSFLFILPTHAHAAPPAPAIRCLLPSKVALYIKFHSNISIMLNFSVEKLSCKDVITCIIGHRLSYFLWLSLLCVASAPCCFLFCSSFRDTNKDNSCFPVRLPWTFYKALQSSFFVDVE